MSPSDKLGKDDSSSLLFCFFTLGGGTFVPMLFLFLYYAVIKIRNRENIFSLSMKSPLFIFTLYCFCSIFWSRGHDLSFFRDYLFPAFLAYIMARDLLAKRPEFLSARFLPVLLAGPIIIVVRGLLDSSGHLLSMGELDTPFEHHTLISMNFLFLVPLVIGRILLEEKRRTLYGIYLVLMILGVIMCGSRVGLVGLFLVLAYITFCFAGRQVRLIGVAWHWR